MVHPAQWVSLVINVAFHNDCLITQVISNPSESPLSVLLRTHGPSAGRAYAGPQGTSHQSRLQQPSGKNPYQVPAVCRVHAGTLGT